MGCVRCLRYPGQKVPNISCLFRGSWNNLGWLGASRSSHFPFFPVFPLFFPPSFCFFFLVFSLFLGGYLFSSPTFYFIFSILISLPASLFLSLFSPLHFFSLFLSPPLFPYFYPFFPFFSLFIPPFFHFPSLSFFFPPFLFSHFLISHRALPWSRNNSQKRFLGARCGLMTFAVH